MPGKLDELIRVLGDLDTQRRLVAAVVHLNDTYVVEERPEHRLPGFPRVIATVEKLRETIGRDKVLVLHSGDFLGPSRVGKSDQGALMIKLLNRMGLDCCVIGNHELDYKKPALLARMKEASFRVLLANVDDVDFPHERILLWPTANQPVVAMTGIVSETVAKSFPKTWTVRSPQKSLLPFFEQTKAVPFRLVLSHATREEDRAIWSELNGRKALPPRSFLLGGHDHDIHWSEGWDGTPILKNRSNLATVRVLLLLAGGICAKLDLLDEELALRGERYKTTRLEDPDKLPGLPYLQGCEASLARIPAVDAGVFRKDLDGRSFPEGTSTESAFWKLASRDDSRSFVLEYGDHPAGDPDAVALIGRDHSPDPAEMQVLRDFSKETAALEARDSALRSGATDFGLFVAECVRLAAEADVALLNSGAFRCDAQLSPVLRLRDLRDTFLYDRSDAILVLDLDRDVYRRLVDHGRSRVGCGAYPHCAEDAAKSVTTSGSLRVAVSAYLLTESTSIDGYDVVLADALHKDRAAAQAWAREHARKRLSIIASVESQVRSVAYRPVAVAKESSELFEFMDHADALRSAILGNGIDVFDAVMNDRPLPDAGATLRRDAIRSWVRSVPEVKRAEEALRHLRAHRSGAVDDLAVQRVMEAHDKLLRLHRELGASLEQARRAFDYDILLKNAAIGIALWSH